MLCRAVPGCTELVTPIPPIHLDTGLSYLRSGGTRRRTRTNVHNLLLTQSLVRPTRKAASSNLRLRAPEQSIKRRQHAKEVFTIVDMGLIQVMTSAGGCPGTVRSVYTVIVSGGVGLRHRHGITRPRCAPLDSRSRGGSTQKKSLRLWIWVFCRL